MTDQPSNTLTVEDDDSPPCAAEACCDADPEPRPKLSNMLMDLESALKDVDYHGDKLEAAHLKASNLENQLKDLLAMHCVKSGTVITLGDTAYRFIVTKDGMELTRHQSISCYAF